MQVRFYANMRTIVGREFFEITDVVGDKTLRSVLNILIENFPDIQQYLFLIQRTIFCLTCRSLSTDATHALKNWAWICLLGQMMLLVCFPPSPAAR